MNRERVARTSLLASHGHGGRKRGIRGSRGRGAGVWGPNAMGA